jgi:uncharacterized protein YkwD
VLGDPGRLTAAIAVAVIVTLLLLIPAGASASGEQRLLTAVNQTRQAHGLPPFRASRNLMRSARRYSHYMLARDYFGHMNRIRVSWSRWSWVGEDLAIYPGWDTRVGSVVRSWMRSPPHRAVLLGTRFRAAGVGYAHGKMGRRRATTVTLHVGRPK